MANNKHIDSLIVREFLGDLSQTEQEELDIWLNHSTDNQQRYDKLRGILENKDLIANWRSIDLESNWQEILTKSKSAGKVFKLKAFIRYAAAASILLFGGTLFYRFQTYTSLTNNQLQPISHILPDGSTVWLKHGAEITFNKRNFPENRMVEMDGEVYFDVKKSSSPFTVDIGKSTVEVLGTSFNIDEENKRTEVILVEGSIRYSNHIENLVLKPGERAISENGSLQMVNEFNPNSIGWMTGRFSFESTPLKNVLALVKEYYGFNYEVNGDLDNILISIEIERMSLKEFSEELSFILDRPIELRDKTLKID